MRVPWAKGGVGPQGKNVFAGEVSGVTVIAAGIADSARRGRIEARLRKVAALVETTRAKLVPTGLAEAVPPTAAILLELSVARGEGGPAEKGSGAAAAAFLDEKGALAATA